MKENKTPGLLKAQIKSYFADIWNNIKAHPYRSLGTGLSLGGSIGGAFMLSSCVHNTPPAIVQPSGDIESGLPSGIVSGEEIESGEIESGDEIESGNPGSGDIGSGELPPSGDIEGEKFPTSVEELSEEQKTALFNAIEENKSEILFNGGFFGSKVENTETVGYDINLTNNTIQALYKKFTNNEDTYFITEIKIKNILFKIDGTVLIEFEEFLLSNNIIFKNKETEFSSNAENVYLFFNKVILPDNARYSAYSIDSQGAFGGGYWPLVTTNVTYVVNGKIYFDSLDIITDGYDNFTRNSDGGARYEERGGFSFTFGDENTLWNEATADIVMQ